MAFLPLILSSLEPLSQGEVRALDRVFIKKSDTEITLNVPFVHQINDLEEEDKAAISTTACGPSALAMLFKFYGVNTDLNQVIENLPGSVYVKGRYFINLKEGTEIYNFKPLEIDPRPERIYETLKEGNPVVLNIQNYDGITGHAVVVVGIKGFDGQKAKSLIVHDPFKAAYREFEYLTDQTLKQPEGYTLSIGSNSPFYIMKDIKDHQAVSFTS